MADPIAILEKAVAQGEVTGILETLTSIFGEATNVVLPAVQVTGAIVKFLLQKFVPLSADHPACKKNTASLKVDLHVFCNDGQLQCLTLSTIYYC